MTAALIALVPAMVTGAVWRLRTGLCRVLDEAFVAALPYPHAAHPDRVPAEGHHR